MGKKSIIEIKSRIYELYKDDYSILDDNYVNNKTKMRVRHNICGQIFLTRMDSFLCNHRQCMRCFGNVKLTIDDLKSRCLKTHGNDYEIMSDQIKNNKSRIIVHHNVCGNTYDIVAHSFLNLETKCAYCNGTKKQSIEDIKKRCYEMHGDDYIILSENIKNIDSKIHVKHSCGFSWNVKATNFINIGSGCPMCAPKSKGEISIREFLLENKVNFISQKTFDNCVSKNSLYFDFYLPDFNLCIEYDGQQHFKSIPIFGGDNALKLQMKRDKIKNDYCSDNKINLLRIPYWNFKEISDILRLKLFI